MNRPLGLTVISVGLSAYGVGAAAGTLMFGHVHPLLAVGSGACVISVAVAVLGIWRMQVWAPWAISAWSVLLLVNLLIFQFTIGHLPLAPFLATLCLFVIFVHMLERYVRRIIILSLS